MRTHAYIDAANLFYGGKKFLGWSVDCEKLVCYLKDKYQVDRIFYFGGVEIYDFPFDYLRHDSVPLRDLDRHLHAKIAQTGSQMTDAELLLLHRHVKRVRFYLKLETFGYQVILKPVKTFYTDGDAPVRKANCDVDLAFFMMRDKQAYDRALVLSGDGDFLPVLKYLRDECGKNIFVLSHASRTAREIKKFAGGKFLDFAYLRERLKRPDGEDGTP